MTISTDDRTLLEEALTKHWGFDGFLPHQEPAMAAVMTDRDSVVVLPTGGGKSLCFQAPAICRPGVAVVVSPLISLMKDQVDGLNASGVTAACLNSSIPPVERRAVEDAVRDGTCKLLYLAPERLVMPGTLAMLRQVSPAFFAVDEAHCISTWGHDFRPEYRELRLLKQIFPGAAVHAYTATATEKVRDDIARELGLEDPVVLVGSFDRPNLTYRVAHRVDRLKQIRAVIERHANESGIIYCISRAEVEKTAAQLCELGHRARPYHAGLDARTRKRHQDEFIRDEAEIIVATVAFGMGIDKPNVRFVIHAGMPRSVEAYQQESGRAGRDGLDGECCLFHSPQDYVRWQQMTAHEDPEVQASAVRSLGAMSDYCTGVVCRRRILLGHFGEAWEKESCGACDVCLGELVLTEEPLIIAQKILSCVVRLRNAFGGDYTAAVLVGSRDQRILKNRHDELSTHGLLADVKRRTVRDWIEQLVGQGYLVKYGEYLVLGVTEAGWRVLRGEETPRLLAPRPAPKKERRKRSARRDDQPEDTWEGVDRDLFEDLRALRRELADERGVPAYVVFGDTALRDMARRRPTTLAAFLEVKGVGEKRCDDYGEAFVNRIIAYTEPEA